MRQRVWCVGVLAFVGVVMFGGLVRADDPLPPAEEHAAPAEHHEAPALADEHHEAVAPAPADEHPAAPAEHHEDPAEHHEDPAEHHDSAQHEDTAEHHDSAQHHEAPAAADEDEEVPYTKFDGDGDGKEDPALKKEYEEAMEGISDVIDTDAVDKALDARPEDAELKPSMTVEEFQKIVLVVKKVVLARMEKKMAASSAKKMAQFSTGIFVFSLLGLFLLVIPLVVGKRYPGKSGVLFKYSALAAVTFFVTVNLFGGVLMGMRTAQGALGNLTNPSLAIASGTFDTLHDNAEDYIVMGKELFVPTLEQLQGNSEEQPSALILANGQKIVKDAKVFVAIANMFKKVDFVFKILPIILFCVTMILFGLAIRPTLTEIVKLPMRAATGEAGVGREVTKRAMRRVWGELLATACTVAVLAGLTFVSAFVLGQIVKPAIDALLNYFSLAVSYLQFVDTASSGLVFLTLFGVILFLVLNLATLILSMSFFLGKSQKIFQQRFNEGVPVSHHKRFFKWGIPAVLLVQAFPWLFVVIAQKVLHAINASLLDGIVDADKVSWSKIMLAGPAFLVIGFAVTFWAVRGAKAIGFLQSYKVKQVASAGQAEAIPPP
jgi:hypothetical protein